MLLHVDDGVAHDLAATFGELVEIEIPDAVLLQTIIGDCRQLDGTTGDLELHFLAGGGAQNFQQERRPGIATQMVTDIVVVALGHVLAVDAEDNVTLLQSHFRRRHVFVRLVDANAPEFEVVADQ